MNHFWENFWPDVASNLLVGLFLGLLVAFWVGKKLNEMERKDEKLAELRKTIHYLELLKGEVSALLQQLPALIELHQSGQMPQSIRIATSFWDALQPSGELPRLMNPRLLNSFTRFYDHLAYAQQGRDWLMDRLVTSTVVNQHTLTQQEIEAVIATGFQDAQEAGTNLPSEIDSEINSLKAKLAD